MHRQIKPRCRALRRCERRRDTEEDRTANSSSTIKQITNPQNSRKKLNLRNKIVIDASNESNKNKISLDYLAGQRSRRVNMKIINHNKDWERDLNNPKLDLSTKYDLIVGKADQIERKAKMKEKVLEVKGGPENDLEMGENINDMFIEAIRAKLAMLEQI